MLIVRLQTLNDFHGDDLEGKDGPLVKVGFDLTLLYREYEAFRQRGTPGPFTSHNPTTPLRDDLVVIDAVANDAAALRADLEALGLRDAAHYGPVVSGWLPITAIPQMAALDRLRLARPAVAMTVGGMKNKGDEGAMGPFQPRMPFDASLVGLTTSQGDAAQRSDVARANVGVDGTGVTVGTLSDSYDQLGGAAGDVASGDLPAGVIVLDDTGTCPPSPTCSDEGRAMMQIIADVAPGAAQFFHTAFGGQAVFALGIEELAGCPPGSGVGCTPSPDPAEVIVDDVFYFAEPFFQDGIIAQAVDGVVSAGHSYFSSAGNSARQAYESPFTTSGITPPGLAFPGIGHDFDPGGGVDIYQMISLPTGTTTISLQWDEPYASATGMGGSTNDIDFHLYAEPPGSAPLLSSITANISGDPIEVMTIDEGAGLFNLVITNFFGADPGVMKYVFFNSGMKVLEFPTFSGTVVGHSNAAGAEAVGAAFYFDTPPFGTDPPVIEGFSSAGPQPILFDLADTPIPDPMRMKPEIVAPDKGNTTFFGSDIPDPGDGSDTDAFPNFEGTSAAASHAAGVAALMLEAVPALTPGEIYSGLETTAIDMDDPFTGGFDVGFDFGTGFGLIDAAVAMIAVGSVTRFVATGGIDPSNDCLDSMAPCATIAHAVSEANPGDTLDIEAGTYAAPGVITKKLNIVAAGVVFE